MKEAPLRVYCPLTMVNNPTTPTIYMTSTTIESIELAFGTED